MVVIISTYISLLLAGNDENIPLVIVALLLAGFGVTLKETPRWLIYLENGTNNSL